MYLLNRRTFLGSSAALAALPQGLRAAASGFHRFTGSANAFFVDSVVIVGDSKSMVLDAQFTHADATALADQIAATGTELETIFVTHFHPDHLLGIATLTDRFPDAQVLAHPDVAALAAKTGPGAFAEYKDFLGYPEAQTWTAPKPHDGPLTLEGESFDVIGPVAGDTGLVTPVAMPQFDAIFASDVVYNGVPVYFAETTTPEAFAGWRAALDMLEARPESVIIPGHKGEGTADDRSGIAFTREQLALWEQALSQSTDRDSLAAAIRDVMGGDPDGFFAKLALDAVYPK